MNILVRVYLFLSLRGAIFATVTADMALFKMAVINYKNDVCLFMTSGFFFFQVFFGSSGNFRVVASSSFVSISSRWYIYAFRIIRGIWILGSAKRFFGVVFAVSKLE